jgi:hypothetical protein
MSHHALIFSGRIKRWQRGAGAHRIASFLREQDWDAEVVDYIFFWKLEELKELVRSRVTSSTVFFGFSTLFNAWTDDLNSFTKWLKETYPTIPIVIGGQSVLLTPAENIDYWVDSYGENAILAVVQDILGTGTAPLVTDMNYFGKRKVVRGLVAYPSAPLPGYHVEFEKRDFMRPWEMPTIETSRGCKFSCEYCNFPILGVKTDQSSEQRYFKRQLEHAYDNWGIKNWLMADETFNDRPEKIQKFADVVDELSFTPWFSAMLRADLLVKNQDTWEDLVRMNCLGHFYGIESFNKDSGKIIGKGMDPEKIKQGLIDFEKYTDIHAPKRYNGHISLICGLPKETKETWNDGIAWLNKHWTRQGVTSWILEISDYDDGLTNMSKFTKNLSKHGLRSLGVKKIATDGNIKENDCGILMTSEKITIWEHDTMSWYDAEALMKEFYAGAYKGRVGNSPLITDKLLEAYQATNVEDIRDKSMNDISDDDPDFIKMNHTYISNKLSWKPL